ncbi:MAG: hypothetical protein JWP01_137 [Myxococcales bacterium]|nr:hypothetical protein [Myxococcales bacterium]
MKDRLFVLKPGFADQETSYFCPFSAQVIGFLSYYPQVRDSLDVIELEFPRPRTPLTTLLGEDHQAAPMLVLGGPPVVVPGVTIREANGHSYVEKTLQILRYLAATRSVPMPH